MSFWRGQRLDLESGSATIYVVAMVMVLMCCAGAALAFSGVITARHRAAGAADLAALAAASVVLQGQDAACARAAQVARAQRAELARCSLGTALGAESPGSWLPRPSEASPMTELPATATADVTVEVALPGWLQKLGPARARARAG